MPSSRPLYFLPVLLHEYLVPGFCPTLGFCHVVMQGLVALRHAIMQG